MLGPIFSRDLSTLPRRPGHFGTRSLVLLVIVVLGATAWQATLGFEADATLGETAAFGMLFFQLLSVVLLLFTLFFAALSAAGAIAQEKDRRTFVLLLVTRMNNFEIVVGKMLGALLPVLELLLVSAPVLGFLLLLGGIGPQQVVQVVVVLVSTAVAAGSLGGLVALWRERTFQSLALTVLALVLYLCVTQGLGYVGPLVWPGMDWGKLQSYVDPFAALQSVLDPPPGSQASSGPSYLFGCVMVVWAVVLNGLGVWKLRVWNPSGEPLVQREGPAEEDGEDGMEADERRRRAHAAPGPVREVWSNPVLWREVRTLAYGRRPLLVKAAYGLVLVLILYFAAQQLDRPGGRPPFAAAFGIVPVAILSLLLVAAQAVTSITSERDSGALDVLLVTDISPKEFVFGKILGVLFNTKEYLLPPLALAVWYGLEGAYARGASGSGNLGPTLAVMGAFAVLAAFAVSLGLHVSLRTISSRTAIANTLATIFFLSVGTMICIYLIVINRGSFANQWVSFILYLVLGIGGLLYVLSADRPSPALTTASVACPLAVFYCITNILIAKPGTDESADPLVPFLMIAASFGFSVAAMLVPLLTEFDVTLGRTSGPHEE